MRIRHKIVVILLAMALFLPVVQVYAIQSNEPVFNYVVKLENGDAKNYLKQIGYNIELKFVFSENPEFINIYTFSSSYDILSLQKYLAEEFIYLEEVRKLQVEAVTVNDPGFTNNYLDIDKTWGLVKSGFTEAWEKTTGSKNNIVAVIDTGIDATHEDLKTINFVTGFDFITNEEIPVGINSDKNGHGTLVAGVLGATTNNGLGISGTNWQISVMPLKALDATGKGDAVSVAESIVWATDHGAMFINLSVGGIGFGHDSSLASAISYAFNKNVVIVAAAGNDTATTGGNIDQNPIFPICDDNNFNMVIGVTVIDQNDLKPEFANYGKNCIDVSAPGKRILSTISFDPLSKKASPNSYAYASGTSLAVPFVIGQATLIKTLYPLATNMQIRDRIISTADPIDNLNLSQCAGSSCRGLLGSGRINVLKSLATGIFPEYSEGDLVKISDAGGIIYQIIGGQKRLVSTFVLNQKFPNATFKNGIMAQLSAFPEGSYVTPEDGTLVKLDNSATIFYIKNGQKFPVTAQVFGQRNFNFKNVYTLSYSELSSWTNASFLPPVEGTLLRASKNKTVYWVVGEVLHPINYNFFKDKGLDVFPILIVPDKDVESFSKGEAFIR